MKVEYEPHPDAQLVRYGANYAVWDRFSATIEPDDAKLPVCHLHVEVESGRAVCVELRVQRSPGGPPVTGTALRQLPLGEYVRRAVGAAASFAVPARAGKRLTVTTEDGEQWPIQHQRIDDEWVAIPTAGLDRSENFQSELRSSPSRREYGGRVTDDELRKVADIYRAAHVARKPPTAEVAREMHVSRSTAGRYVQRARKQGFLGPTRPRVAGEES